MHKVNGKKEDIDPRFQSFYVEISERFSTLDEEDFEKKSATNGDYSPIAPWNAPGMSVSDFI